MHGYSLTEQSKRLVHTKSLQWTANLTIHHHRQRVLQNETEDACYSKYMKCYSVLECSTFSLWQYSNEAEKIVLASHWSKESWDKKWRKKTNKQTKKQTNKQTNKKTVVTGRQTHAGLCSQYSATDKTFSAQGSVLGSIPGNCWPFHLCLNTSFRLQSKLLDLVYDGTILVPESQ